MGRTIGIILVVIAIIVAILFFTGFFEADVDGEIRAPEVSVQGGEMPDVNVDAGDIEVGSEEETVTVEVPTVDVQSAEEDGVDSN